MDMPVFGVGIRQGNNSNARLTVVYYLLAIVVLMMAKPAHASGTVNLATIYYGGWNSSGYNCSGLSSLKEVQDCMLAMHDKWLADDLSGLNSNPNNLPPEPLSCPTAVLTDSGPSSSYVDVFHITYYRGGINAAGWTCCPINYKICDGPKVDDFNISTNLACPANSQPNGTTCTCNDNFMPDATETSCVPINSCPANMSGSPCTCNPGTVPSSSGEGCVAEQFTLSDPQNQPKLPDVEPGSSRAVTARVVSDQTGLPKQGAMVRFHLDVDLTSGGHAHGETLGRRPRGSISSSNCVPEPGGDLDTYDCPTGPDGYTDSTFNAPEISGTHTITATCISAQCSGSISDNINVKVPDLIPIPNDPALYALIGGETGKQHHDNHYLTSSALDQLFVLVINYHVRYPNEPVLHLNDASLVWGGKFDINGNWVGDHKGHKRGTVIDIRANTAEGNIPENLFDDFKNLAKDTKLPDGVTSAIAQVHCSRGRNYSDDKCVGDDNRHFHVILLGVDQ